MGQRIEVRKNGKLSKMSKFAAMLMLLVNKAVSGDLKAVGILFPLIQKMEISREERRLMISELSEDDRDILRSYAKRQ